MTDGTAGQVGLVGQGKMDSWRDVQEHLKERELSGPKKQIKDGYAHQVCVHVCLCGCASVCFTSDSLCW